MACRTLQPRCNASLVRVARVQGTFGWHAHEHEDEMFLAMKGSFRIEFRDRTVELSAGEFVKRAGQRNGGDFGHAQLIIAGPESRHE